MPKTHFTPELFAFLRDLAANNNREFFQAEKERYLAVVREPLQAFVGDFGGPLARLSEHFVADPRAQGGSIFRIHRDVRFSKDKRPYKTNASAQFRHEAGRDVHAPGFYLHLEPGRVFVGAGIWHPDSAALRAIREEIVAIPKAWQRVVGGKAFRAAMQLGGDSLKRPPRGFEQDHPLIEDLKRKDFFCFQEFDEEVACEPGFLQRYTKSCRTALPLMRFLCDALDLPI